MAEKDWRPERIKAATFSNEEIDILQKALDVYHFEHEFHDLYMARLGWEPVTDLIRKLEQLRVGH